MNQSPTAKAQLAAFLSRFPAGTVALAKRCLARLRRAFPGAYELVYDYPRSVVVAFGTSERGYEAIVALALDDRGVRLYFDKSLPDPQGLLEGTGAKVRSVAVQAASDLDHGAIPALLKAARQHAGASFPRTGATRLVIKSGSKRRKRRRAAPA